MRSETSSRSCTPTQRSSPLPLRRRRHPRLPEVEDGETKTRKRSSWGFSLAKGVLATTGGFSAQNGRAIWLTKPGRSPTSSFRTTRRPRSLSCRGAQQRGRRARERAEPYTRRQYKETANEVLASPGLVKALAASLEDPDDRPARRDFRLRSSWGFSFAKGVLGTTAICSTRRCTRPLVMLAEFIHDMCRFTCAIPEPGVGARCCTGA